MEQHWADLSAAVKVAKKVEPSGVCYALQRAAKTVAWKAAKTVVNSAGRLAERSADMRAYWMAVPKERSWAAWTAEWSVRQMAAWMAASSVATSVVY
jgi:hypothetical protein